MSVYLGRASATATLHPSTKRHFLDAAADVDTLFSSSTNDRSGVMHL